MMVAVDQPEDDDRLFHWAEPSDTEAWSLPPVPYEQAAALYQAGLYGWPAEDGEHDGRGEG